MKCLSFFAFYLVCMWLYITALSTSFLIALISSPIGVSGAFLLLPLQISVFGLTSPVANSTNLIYNLIATPSGVYRYIREKRMNWPLATIIALTPIPGAYIGVYIRTRFLLDPKLFKFLVGLILLSLSLRIGYYTLKSRNPKNTSLIGDATIKTRRIGLRRVEYEFMGNIYSIPTIPLTLISISTGVIGGIYGIGGAAIISPILISIFHLPIHTTAGATLLTTLTTSTFTLINYHITGYPPNWNIGLTLGIGGILGTYLGAKLQKHIPEKILGIILLTTTLTTSTNYILQYIT
ncbi:MAG: sulfite exporter TauE/SafE family protein [Candidatus Methanomethylicia archaeon]